jgi:fermentation-respiration switch protein FrsA (DUF1100 family)
MGHRRSKLADAAVPLLAGGAAVVAAEAARRLYRLHQLFEPSREPEIDWDPASYGLPRDRVEPLAIQTPDGETLDAWYCRAPRPIASSLYCHGNKGNLTTVAHAIPYLLDAGLSVLLFDYRGYGRSSGHPSVGGIAKDVLAAARVHERIRPRGRPSILYGYSLGGAIAAQAVRKHPFDGFILQSTFTTLPEVTRVLFPRLPLHLVSGNLYDTLSVIRKLDLPVLFLNGGADEVCPISMTHALHDACPSTHKRLVIVEGGHHKDLYQLDPDALVWAVSQFVTGLAENAVIASAAR